MSISHINIIKYKASTRLEITDAVAIEEPLEISIAYKQATIWEYKTIAVTMRTTGNDTELALGFLFSEQIINATHLIEKIKTKGENKICIYIANELKLNLANVERNFYTSSSCGVCGKASIASVMKQLPECSYPKAIQVSIETIYSLKNAVNNFQSAFEKTGGIHASSLFTLSGEFLHLFEDVGRHNALDKLIGHNYLNKKYALNENILLLSGRASFELIQKASIAQIPIVVALGAPSSLAIQLAIEMDITLIGFLKDLSANVYSGVERII